MGCVGPGEVKDLKTYIEQSDKEKQEMITQIEALKKENKSFEKRLMEQIQKEYLLRQKFQTIDLTFSNKLNNQKEKYEEELHKQKIQFLSQNDKVKSQYKHKFMRISQTSAKKSTRTDFQQNDSQDFLDIEEVMVQSTNSITVKQVKPQNLEEKEENIIKKYITLAMPSFSHYGK